MGEWVRTVDPSLKPKETILPEEEEREESMQQVQFIGTGAAD